MAERQKEKYGREFLFPGAGIDGIETAGRFGISADRTADHNSGCGGAALIMRFPRTLSAVCVAAPIGAGGKNALGKITNNAGRRLNQQIEQEQRIVGDVRTGRPTLGNKPLFCF